ncbi:diaminopimelate epimerase [Clostridiaceae bacterium M8S5]|nr:diaminopimelate epimerase [Clostridiaceae bacterium M8S5]
MNIEFYKLQGLGNDFIIVDNRKYNLSDKELSTLASRVCKRKLSVGADGLMAVNNPVTEGTDFLMKFYNTDGSIAEMCGNGARCIARYSFEENIVNKQMSFETTAGVVNAEILDNRQVKIQLNNPSVLELDKTVYIEGKKYECSYIELGNPGVPHCVIKYDNLANTDNDSIFELGRSLRYNKAFPKGANINFYDIIDENTAIVKTYERGVEDFTLACGTGSTSVAIALILKGILRKDTVNILVEIGALKISLLKDNNAITKVFLTGDTNIVCKGIITDEDLK